MSEHDRFMPPQTVRHAVWRQALLARLDAAGMKRLTTIVAPAGYGKTSLAGQWFERLTAGGGRAAWITLESDHRNPSTFLLALLEALTRLTSDSRVAQDASSLSPASLSALVATRLRQAPDPLHLFLDDYHFAQTDAIDSVLARLLADRTLDHLKLVLVSRSAPRLPLSALRLNGELKQIGMVDLAFSDGEAEAFFGGHGGGLTAGQIGSLNRQTEGWAVALQMVRVLVSDDAGADALLSILDAGTAEMGSYLSEQVFAHLPARLQTLLLETAALPAINRELAAAISTEVNAASLFEQLAAPSLPVAQLGGAGGWVRCHPVFQAFLRAEAGRRGEDAAGSLRKAARWFEAKGDCDAAVRHALPAGDANLAADIVEKAGGWRRVYVSRRGGTTLFQAIIDRAAEIDLARFPLATLGLAVTSAKTGRLDDAGHYLAMAERGIGEDPALASDLRVVRVLLSLYLDRSASDADLSALEDDLLTRRDMELIHRALALNMLCFNALGRSELDRALHYGELALRAFRDGNADFGAMHLFVHIGQAALFNGDGTRAGEAYDRLTDEAQRHIGPGSDLDALGQVLKGELLALQRRDEEAEACLSWALPHLERHDTWFDPLAAGLTAQLRILLGRGDAVAAHALLDRLQAVARRRGFDRLSWLVEGERSMALIASGDAAQAARYAESRGMGRKAIGLSRANDLSIHPRGTVPALLWTRLDLAAGDLKAARDSFSKLLTRQTKRPTVPRSIELALLDIRLLLAEQRPDAAAARLGDLVLGTPLSDYRALVRAEGHQAVAAIRALAESGLLSGVVTQRLSQVLDDGMPAANDGATGSNGGLTERERRVVELLGTGLSNKEIGRKLSMSDNTVKFHLRNIYAKLKVGTRLAAVTAAREIGLLVG